jgi:hypothetical protein
MNYLKHLDSEMANGCYFYLQTLKFNPALIVMARQNFYLMLFPIIFSHHLSTTIKKTYSLISKRLHNKQTIFLIAVSNP